MKNDLVQLSYEVVWDGLTEYESNKAKYDNEGRKHNCSGMDYFLKEYLCNGANFSSQGESLVREILGVNDSPMSNSLHDAEFYHPLLGHCKFEIRCFKGKGNLHFCHQSEIGGSRCPSKQSDRDGSRTYLRSHKRTIHKIESHTHFCYIDLTFAPLLRISIVPSESILHLWDNGNGVLSVWRNCRINEDKLFDPPVFERKPVIKLNVSTSQFYKWFYKKKRHAVKWESVNPYGISEKRKQENIDKFNNILGYDIKFRNKGITEKRITIDDRIKAKNISYQSDSNAIEINSSGAEVVDLFGAFW